jgi:hypothetical protein
VAWHWSRSRPGVEPHNPSECLIAKLGSPDFNTIQYTVFEQLKNVMITRRTTKLRATTGAAKAIAVLSDLDYFWLGAISKLGANTFVGKYERAD